MNILVVEDNYVERSNLVRMLKSLDIDIKIFEAITGEEAIKTLEQETIQLVYSIQISILKNNQKP
ncbi:response regulator [Clostridium formicaceticum]|uniref:Stage 0 sporulation protein A homolog n=1 Tax=Clostridium formicaceticum TaxID=1497 RepID=A0AAC9RM90_9CLOT|nr:response regulator [Clostridium formicaceticum]AOY77593.1 hypothetical protein BJL90_18060 [Clostridium formicaceticum]ARE88172.1 hypothetical protein CLFO_25730 [Clostridium formicaceticum]